MVHISSRGIHNQSLNSIGITLFGGNTTNKRDMKRHKFIHKKIVGFILNNNNILISIKLILFSNQS